MTGGTVGVDIGAGDACGVAEETGERVSGDAVAGCTRGETGVTAHDVGIVA